MGIISLQIGPIGLADVIPNDPYFLPYQWYLQKMNVPSAWDVSLGSAGTSIGVLDTGIIFDTPELQSRFLTPLNGVEPDVSETSAENVHGTWVASTIAMPINNGMGGAGTGNFSILPIRVTNEFGNSTDKWVKQGIKLATDHDSRVLTISVSIKNYQDINVYVESILQQRTLEGKKDFLVFLSAGNSNLVRSLGDSIVDNAAARLPADHLILVAGTDENDAHWMESPTVGSNVGAFVDLSAPAHNILVANGTDLDTPYGLASGTSFASPFAASAAALAFSINPDLTARQVQDLLFDTAYNPNNPHPGTPYWDQTFGWGRVDFGALAAAAAATVPEPASLGLFGLGAVTMLLRRRRHGAGS